MTEEKKLKTEFEIDSVSDQSIERIEETLDRLDEKVAVDATKKLAALLIDMNPAMAGKSALAAAFYFNNPPINQKDAAYKFNTTNQTVGRYAWQLSEKLGVPEEDFQADKGIENTREDVLEQIAEALDWDEGKHYSIVGGKFQSFGQVKKPGLISILKEVEKDE